MKNLEKYDGVALGIELGSTRIKAKLINDKNDVLAMGDYEWSNKLINGIWTYSQKEIIQGLQKCYASLKSDFHKRHKKTLKRIQFMGISAMMHGYIVLNEHNELLVPFRTWRNTITQQASAYLSNKFAFNVPQRWSVSHLYQAILNKESHINKVKFQTTLAGYVHYLLTDQKVIGVGDGSGMFPIDSKTKNYDNKMVNIFNKLLKEKHLNYSLTDIFPKILLAGDNAGVLTKQGALLLDPSGDLDNGTILCPPEGDAGTGMIATNAVKPLTGNVSAGTSIFGMLVLNKNLKSWHKEIDVVTTPSGFPVAMIHCNNCSTDINAWIKIFDEYNKLVGVKMDKHQLFNCLFSASTKGNSDCGGLVSCNYHSGEHITEFAEGRPFVAYSANSKLNLANLFKVLIYSSFVTLKIGYDILKKENVKISQVVGQGGIFHTKGVGQKALSAALGIPVTVIKNASNKQPLDGSYGMAILAKYLNYKNINLPDFLSKDVFKNSACTTIRATKNEIDGFNKYTNIFKHGLEIEKIAIKSIKLANE